MIMLIFPLYTLGLMSRSSSEGRAAYKFVIMLVPAAYEFNHFRVKDSKVGGASWQQELIVTGLGSTNSMHVTSMNSVDKVTAPHCSISALIGVICDLISRKWDKGRRCDIPIWCNYATTS